MSNVSVFVFFFETEDWQANTKARETVEWIMFGGHMFSALSRTQIGCLNAKRGDDIRRESLS